MIQFKKLNFKIDEVWISSDFHAYHKNIAKGSSSWIGLDDNCRDFENEIEMTNHLVEQINKYVKEEHLLIHCGDWSFGNKNNILKFRNQLNCRNIICIEGNHDHHNIEFQLAVLEDKLVEFNQIGYYQVEGKSFMCTHYPQIVWHQSHKGVPNFFGHVHGSNPGLGKSLDTGVDNAFKILGEYRPFRLREAFNIIDTKEIYFESHHNINTN